MERIAYTEITTVLLCMIWSDCFSSDTPILYFYKEKIELCQYLR